MALRRSYWGIGKTRRVRVCSWSMGRSLVLVFWCWPPWCAGDYPQYLIQKMVQLLAWSLIGKISCRQADCPESDGLPMSATGAFQTLAVPARAACDTLKLEERPRRRSDVVDLVER